MLEELQSHRDCIGARYGTNPQHIKSLNGHKTDPKDAEWIAELLETGKLKGSWAPEREIREVRDLTRQRAHVLEDMNRVKNRIEQLSQTGTSRCPRWRPICSVYPGAGC